MSQIVYRANLNASTFPFLSDSFGRSVIFKGPDQNWTRQITSPEDPDKDIGVPQVFYCHNVMPTPSGFESIGYYPIATGLPGVTEFSSIYVLRDSAENKAYFVHAISGNNYVLLPGASTWLQINSIPSSGITTVARANGQSYVYFQGVGCYSFNFATNLLVAVPLSGISLSAIVGIAAVFGYLIAWTTTALAWSSTIDPTDFVPSLATGAGGGSVQGIRGAITVCAAHSYGIMVYTTTNIVAAVYTNNARYPFTFQEIVSSGGAASLDIVAWDSNSGNQYVYTTSGLQSVSQTGTSTIYPELTDFISGQYFEDFDEASLTLTKTIAAFPMQKKLVMIADRYIIISYGLSSLTHALIYDAAQKRWGKVKVPHVDCFDYELLAPVVIDTPKKSIAFLQNDGTVKVIDFSIGSGNTFGVMILGKYQYVRTRLTQLQEVSVENVAVGNTFNLYALPCLDGKTLGTPIPGYLKYIGPQCRDYSFRATALSHAILMVGAFYMCSVELTFNIHGTR